MLVAPSQFEELYDGALREDLASSEDKKLLVFVSTGEADSVCATRILQVRATPPNAFAALNRVHLQHDVQARLRLTHSRALRDLLAGMIFRLHGADAVPPRCVEN